MPARVGILWGGWEKRWGHEEETSDMVYWGLLKKATRKGDKLKKDKNGDKKEKGKQEADREGGWEGWKNQDKSGEGGVVSRAFLDNVTWHTLLILAQRRDPASPSAQGQGRSKGSASHPPPPQPPCVCTQTQRIHPPFSFSPGRHPTRPAYISIKQLHSNLLPCRVGGAMSGIEQ